MGWYQTEPMLVATLKAYREFDRSQPFSATNPFGHTYTPERLAELRRSIRDDGIRAPGMIEYAPDRRVAILGEGNHRLWLAEDLGLATVPVRGVLASPSWIGRRPAVPVPGVPRLVPEPGHGYFPATFRPSEVFPPEFFPAGQLAGAA